MQTTDGTVKGRQTFPKIIKSGSAVAKVYQVKNRTRSIYSLVYYAQGGRQIRQFTKLGDAMAEGETVTEAINNGRAQVLELSGAERESFMNARDILAPTGIPLIAALTEYTEAKKLGVPLIEAARFYHSRMAGKVIHKKVPIVVDEFLKAKAEDGMSQRYLSDIRSRLGRFAADFQTDIAGIEGTTIDTWLRGLGLSARSRNNYLSMIRTLWCFAQGRGYLPKGETAVESLNKAKSKGGDVGIFTPEQFALLLSADYKALKLPNAKAEVLIPYFVLGGLCGLRHAEITRLDWKEIDLHQKIVRVTAAKSKTAQNRIVPICEAGLQWLAPYRNRVGQVCSDRQSKTGRAVAEKLKIPWPPNGLRHSFGSYRLAHVKSAPEVALEMGNSVSMIFGHYRALVTEADAQRWFAIAPSGEAAEKIIRFGKGTK